MIDQLVIVELIGWFSIQIDHPVAGARAAAGESQICFARFPWPVHHASYDRKRHWGGDVLQAVFQHPHSIDHIKTLSRAGWTRYDVHAAVAQVQRLQNIES